MQLKCTDADSFRMIWFEAAAGCPQPRFSLRALTKLNLWALGLWLLWIIWDAWSMLAYDGLVQHLVIQNPKACSLHRPFDLESRVRTSDMTIWALWDVVCRMRLFLICGSSGAHISKRQRHSEMVAMVIHGHSSVICAWSHIRGACGDGVAQAPTIC